MRLRNVVLFGLSTVGVLALVATNLGFLVAGVTSSTVKLDSDTLAPQTPAQIVSSTKTIERLNLPADRVIYLNGVVNAVSSKFVVDELKAKAAFGKDLYLLIDSPGGSVFDGAMVISAMEASESKVHTVCIGMCASMAFIIHQYGATRLMLDRSILMAHPASGGVQGTLEQMGSRLGVISRFVEKINLHISKRAGLTLEQFKARFLVEMWLDAEDCVADKFADKLVSIKTDAKAPEPIFGMDRVPPRQNSNIELTW